ncbi:ParA family protein [uncultured Cetobacterium sp.]|uniref:ParA family protein n=1 Tax=uncultured Cetobacterium sp. TaxID=527638 RepID=UPI00262AC09F|nr:ParA family protein [uncultured Cetobacterium sp.]
MKKTLNISLAYKKDKRLNQARINISKDILNMLFLSIKNKKIQIKYENKKIQILSIDNNCKIETISTIKENKLIYFQTSKNLAFEKVGNKLSNKIYYSCKLFIPLPIIKDLKITKTNNKISMNIINNKIILTLEEENITMNNGKIFTIKVNKGGIGKTFLTAQLGHGLSLLDKRVLLLTSDSQNNIFNYLLKGDKNFEQGLKSEVIDSNGEYFRLRKNLYFLPLENNRFSSQFINKLPSFLETLKKEYDYILIDSVPTLKIDSTFLECSDKIIIPAYCDEVTIEGILNLVEEIDINKIHSILINRYKNTKTQNKYFDELKNMTEDTDIIFPRPIPQLAFIEEMLDKKKSIWEYTNKQATEVQEILLDILEQM